MKKIMFLLALTFALAGGLKADNTAPQFQIMGPVSLTVLSSTATTISLTNSAKCPNCKIAVAVFAAATGGAVAFDFGNIAVGRSGGTPPTTLTSLLGPHNAQPGTTSWIYGPFAPGTDMFLVGTTTTANVLLRLDMVP
jgi:hypothetical protein